MQLQGLLHGQWLQPIHAQESPGYWMSSSSTVMVHMALHQQHQQPQQQQ
jgi:hypothetical protein